MAQRQFSVGTTPVLLANGNAKRTAISVSMIPSSISAGNTGVVYVLKGAPPQASVGEPSSGDPISQGSQWQEVGQYTGDPNIYKGPLWATADTAAQLVVVDETTEDYTPNERQRLPYRN